MPRKYLRSSFIDKLNLHVRGGAGGSGLPRYGGIGGTGGNVYVVAKEKLTLKDTAQKLKTKRVKAEPGGDSLSKGIIGAPGEDQIIPVPVGVIVYNQNRVKLGEHNFYNIACTSVYLRHYFILSLYRNYRRVGQGKFQTIGG